MTAGGRDLEPAAEPGLALQVGEVGQGWCRRLRPAAAPGRRGPRRRRGRRGPRASATGATAMPATAAPRPRWRPRRRSRGRRRARPARPSPARPGSGRIEPSSASSPASHHRSSTSPGSCSEATRIAAAIARSKPGPALRRSAGARLAVIRWSGNSNPRVDDRRPDPLARLAHGRVGQADEREGRQAPMDVDLDVDGDRVDAGEGECAGPGEHGAEARGRRRTRGALGVPNRARKRRRISAPAPGRSSRIGTAPARTGTLAVPRVTRSARQRSRTMQWRTARR